MANPDPETSIDDQAAVWAARSAYDDMTEENRAQLEAWLARDHRHRGSYLRAQAAAIVLDDAVIQGRPALASDNDNMDNGNGDNRWWEGSLLRWSAMAACVAMLMVAAPPMWHLLNPAPMPHVETVALADGSTAKLDDGARISVTMSENGRRITLLGGRATFHVAKDISRPFVVRSGDVYAQATGTVYSVNRLGASGGTVSVTEGKVLVWAGDERDRAVLLHAGGILSLDPGKAGHTASEKKEAPPASPQASQISFDDIPIATAAARFNQLQNARRIIVDPGLADIKLVGLFRANDPEQFARAAAAVSGGRVEHAGNQILIRER